MYKVEEVPGKGEGAIATLSIKRGTIIEREKLLFAISVPHTKMDVLEILRSLSADDQRQFFALKNAYPSIPVVGIVKTNAVMVGPDSNRAGVFLKASRFNHSCSPNCVSWCNEAGSVEVIQALKDILPGQELTIPYSSDDSWFSPRLIRQAKLSKKFNFKCTCDVCVLSGNALSLSEERRNALVRLESMVGQKIVPDPGQALGFCRRMLTLLAEEELPLGRSTAYAYASQVCVANGDLLRASAFMAKYVAEIKSQQGDDAVVHEERFLKNPETHPYANVTSAWKTSKKPKYGPETPEFEEWLWERAV